MLSSYSSLPSEIKQTNRFVLWQRGALNPATGRRKKVPISAEGVKCDHMNPENWLSYDQAIALLGSTKADGIGVVLVGDGLSCLDIDGTSQLNGSAAQVCQAFAGTWSEMSQSGDGTHIFFYGTPTLVPENRKNFQLYTDKQYIALTGRTTDSAAHSVASLDFDSTFPLPLVSRENELTQPQHATAGNAVGNPGVSGNSGEYLSDEKILQKAFAAKNGKHIEALYRSSGNSEDDLRLTAYLCFYTHSKFGGGDAQLTRILLSAPLIEARKDAHKWTDYIARNIKKATGKVAKHYDPTPRAIKPAAKPATPGVHPSQPGQPSQPSQAAQQTPNNDWMDGFLTTKEGTPKSHMMNIALIFKNDPEWKGVIALNLMSGKIQKVKTPPYKNAKTGDWEDFDDSATVEAISNKYRFAVSVNHVIEAVSVVSRNNQFHPVRDYLNSLAWDGVPRVAGMFKTYFGAVAGDDKYLELVGTSWMVSAIARVMNENPNGVKVDTVLILEGEQGIGKSSALRILAHNDDWYTDSDIDLKQQKDTLLLIRGKLIVELAELDTMRKSDADAFKAFISKQSDEYRPPYGRRVENVPRQCVFAGTGNKDEYLKDETGARRFMPVHCYAIDLEQLRRDCDQLWAEAHHMYKDGVPWWFDAKTECVVIEQEKRFDQDIWHDHVCNYLKDKDYVTASLILSDSLDIEIGKQTANDKAKIGKIMAMQKEWLGPKQVRRKIDGKDIRERGYIRI